jgi:DNA polymerase-3 subunit epsilon
LEIAALNLTTGEEFYVAPYLRPGELAGADPEAMAINRYYERRVFKDALENGEANANAFKWLKEMLTDKTFAGSNPSFDAPKIAKLIGSEPWHHRMLDLAPYAAGVLGLPLGELPGLHKVCELLGVRHIGEHTALGDVRATAECFRALAALSGNKIPEEIAC